MFMANRKPGESIQIGDAKVTVVKSGRTRVRISVDAPADVKIGLAGKKMQEMPEEGKC